MGVRVPAQTQTRYYNGDDPERLVEVANVADASYKAKFPSTRACVHGDDGYVFTSPVGRFKPNAWGLYDMHGNASEWCADWYNADYYGALPSDDPSGPSSGTCRVSRGGAWGMSPLHLRAARRSWSSPAVALFFNGFRVALDPKPTGLGATASKSGAAKPASAKRRPPASAAARATEETNSIGMKMLLIPAGEFVMGSGDSSEQLDKAYAAYGTFLPGDLQSEYPRHQVRITRPFYLGVYHVTKGEFRRFVTDSGYKTDAETDGKGGFGYDAGGNTSQKPEYTWQNMGSQSVGWQQTDDQPALNVTWNDAVAFCKWLSGKEGKTCRLPTEAEWEYACRAGTETLYSNGNDPERLVEVANVADASCKAKFPLQLGCIREGDGYAFAAPVGRFKPNAWGLYDMHGNASEWCADWYGAEYYGVSTPDDPSGPSSGVFRTFRGGYWSGGPYYSRSARRGWGRPNFRHFTIGFRIARELGELPSTWSRADGRSVLPVPIPAPKPAPAIYQISVEPAEAKLAVMGRGVAVEGENGRWRLTISEPDSRTRIRVRATMAGYQPQERELQPGVGEVCSLTMQLTRKSSAISRPVNFGSMPPIDGCAATDNGFPNRSSLRQNGDWRQPGRPEQRTGRSPGFVEEVSGQ